MSKFPLKFLTVEPTLQIHLLTSVNYCLPHLLCTRHLTLRVTHFFSEFPVLPVMNDSFEHSTLFSAFGDEIDLETIRTPNCRPHRFPESIMQFYELFVHQVIQNHFQYGAPAEIDHIRGVCTYLAFNLTDYRITISDAASYCFLSEELFENLLSSVLRVVPYWKNFFVEEVTTFYAHELAIPSDDIKDMRDFINEVNIETLANSKGLPVAVLVAGTLAVYKARKGLQVDESEIKTVMDGFFRGDFFLGYSIMVDQYASRITCYPIKSKSKPDWFTLEPGVTPGTLDVSELTFGTAEEAVNEYAMKLRTPALTIAFANELFRGYYSILAFVTKNMEGMDLRPICLSCLWIAEEHHRKCVSQNEFLMICNATTEMLFLGLREIEYVFPKRNYFHNRNLFVQPAMRVLAQRAGFNEQEVGQTLKLASELADMFPLRNFLNIAVVSLYVQGVKFGRAAREMKEIAPKIGFISPEQFSRFCRLMADSLPEWARKNGL